MKYFYKFLPILFTEMLAVLPAFAVDLIGETVVNQTSDTSANAKRLALNGARRDILEKVLSQYSDKDSLYNLLINTKNEDLATFISSSSISNEKMSGTVYSANITMTLDNDAVKKWLDDNNIQNWVPVMQSADYNNIVILVSNGISDWADIKKIVRDNKGDIDTVSINGTQIIAKIPTSYRSSFTASVRQNGWHYTDNDGILQIWK